MASFAQTSLIAGAIVATFTGAYWLTPAAQSEEAPVAAEAKAKPAGAKPAAAKRHANPLEPAERGFIECGRPNDARKTCQSMSTYEALGQGRYTDTTVALISNDGPTLIQLTVPATLKSGMVCVKMRPSLYAKSKLIVGDRPLSSREAAPILAAISRLPETFPNKEVCTSYFSSFGEVAAKAVIDGVPKPGLSKRVKWVRPNDGYTVAP